MINSPMSKRKNERSAGSLGLSAILAAASLGFLNFPAQALDIGITPFPKNGENATTKDTNNALKMTVDAGVTGIFYGGTWADLEPEKGNYSMDTLTKTLKYSTKLKRFVGIQVIDITKKNIPVGISKGKLDNPKTLKRFQKFLEKLKRATGGKMSYISLGNEADVYMIKHPKELDDYLAFYAKAKEEVEKIFPGCKTGITLRAENLLTGKEPNSVTKKLLEASDVAMFNYYPVENYRPRKKENIENDMAKLKELSGDKQIVFQEIGYPASKKLGTSEKNQADFIERTINEMRSDDRVQFANFMLLHDFTPAIADFLAQNYGFTSKNYRPMIQNLGLRKSTGKPKMAWQVMKKALKEVPATPAKTTPETPATPETPTTTTPATPETPTTPETPATPTTPTTPTTTTPETPATPSTPATPETPSTPATPETPEKTAPSSPETPSSTTPNSTTPSQSAPDNGASTTPGTSGGQSSTQSAPASQEGTSSDAQGGSQGTMTEK